MDESLEFVGTDVLQARRARWDREQQPQHLFVSDFGAGWCARWSECGLPGACEETQPFLTHYENGYGITFCCEPVHDVTRWQMCIDRMKTATCDEVEAAAQAGETNGPWLDLCVIMSCV